jgi:diaminohydroxyphosphoribosylaminopyrimidine deaminase/5-amino-6-(5-phosphoribosylamino)uracil reductase
MRRALALAARARTHPNPMVGAVVVREGRIVSEGWHRGVGTPHAEAAALAAADERATDATVYVTLEPCSFASRSDGSPRTPCSARCIAAGVSRVVAALEDPDPRVSGQGFAQLRAVGIEVTVGVEEERARALNHAYIRHRKTGLPYVIHKAAMTLDGKIAAPGGDARWVTGEEARKHVHRLRNQADAVVVGIGTVLADDPELNTRLPGRNVRDPFRVIIDSRLRLPMKARAVRPGTMVITTDRAEAARRLALEEAGVEVVEVRADAAGRVDVMAAAACLAGRGLLALLLESGGELAASFWQAGLVSKALFFVAPKIMGGAQAATPVGGPGLSWLMSEAVVLGRMKIRRFGQDIALEGEVSG